MDGAAVVSRGRVTRRLVALSSAAILSVYAIGYVRTEEAAQAAAGQYGSPVGADTALPPTPEAVATTLGGGSTRAPAGAPTLAPTSPGTGAYMDGIYVGSGASRHGGIEATVVVRGGRIEAVAISQCLTRYPCSRIAGLPAQAVDRQSARVDVISGASDSSQAFVQAVTNALARAR